MNWSFSRRQPLLIPDAPPVPDEARSSIEGRRPEAPVIPKFDPSEKILNGRRAEALLSDPVLAAVFEAIAHKYRQTWENAPRGDVETQRIAHLCLAALKDVQGALRAHLGNAKILEADLAQKKARDQAKQPY